MTRTIFAWLWFIVALGAAALSVWFLLHTMSLRSSVTTLADEAQLLSVQAARVSETRTALHDTEKSRAALAKITAGVSAVDIIDAIDAAARATNAKADIRTASPAGVNPNDSTLQAFSFAIHVTGTWTHVSRFTQLMLTLPYVVTVDRISLTNSSDTGWEGDLRLIAYVENNPVTPSATSSKQSL